MTKKELLKRIMQIQDSVEELESDYKEHVGLGQDNPINDVWRSLNKATDEVKLSIDIKDLV